MKTLIVGNGPAGISTARALSNGSTVLVAPDDLPRPGVCGGVLTPPSCQFLRRGGVVETLLENGARRLEAVVVIADQRRLHTLRLGTKSMLSMSRERFDRTLFHQWVPADVRRRVGYVRRVEKGAGGILARMRDGSTIRADGVVDASGHRRLCSRNTRGNSGSGATLIGIEWTGGEAKLEDRLYLVGFAGGYAGVTPISTTNGGRNLGYTVSAVIRTEYVQKHGPRRTWRRIHGSLTPPLRGRLPEQPPCDPLTKAGFWNEVDGPVGSRWAAAGDAAGFTTPLTGEGIWMALREGHLVGEFLSKRRAGGWPLTPSQQEELGRQLVEPFQRQLPRWKLSHFLATHPGWLLTVHRLLPGLTGWLIKRLFPVSDHWTS